MSGTATAGTVWHRRRFHLVSASRSICVGSGRGHKPRLDVCGVSCNAIGPATPKVDRDLGTRGHGLRHVASCMGHRDSRSPLEFRLGRRSHLQRFSTVAPDRARRLRIRFELDLRIRSDAAARTAPNRFDTQLGNRDFPLGTQCRDVLALPCNRIGLVRNHIGYWLRALDDRSRAVCRGHSGLYRPPTQIEARRTRPRGPRSFSANGIRLVDRQSSSYDVRVRVRAAGSCGLASCVYGSSPPCPNSRIHDDIDSRCWSATPTRA